MIMPPKQQLSFSEPWRTCNVPNDVLIELAASREMVADSPAEQVATTSNASKADHASAANDASNAAPRAGNDGKVHPYFLKDENLWEVFREYVPQRNGDFNFLDGEGWRYQCNKDWLKAEGFASPCHFWAEYDHAMKLATAPAGPGAESLVPSNAVPESQMEPADASLELPVSADPLLASFIQSQVWAQARLDEMEQADVNGREMLSRSERLDRIAGLHADDRARLEEVDSLTWLAEIDSVDPVLHT